MFKELGQFIDDVGRATGKIIKRGVDNLLNDENKDDDIEGLMGDYRPEVYISVKIHEDDAHGPTINLE